MKKSQIILLYIVVLMIIFTTNVYATMSANLGFKIDTNNQSLHAGDEFIITLGLENVNVTNGIKAIEGYIDINKDILEDLTLESIVTDENGKVKINDNNLLEVYDASNISSNSENGIIFNTNPFSGKGNYKIVINLNEPITQDTDLVSFKFKIKDGVSEGRYSSVMTYKLFNIVSVYAQEKGKIGDKGLTLLVAKKEEANNNQNDQEIDNTDNNQNNQQTDNTDNNQNNQQTDNTDNNQNNQQKDNTDNNQNNQQADNTDNNQNNQQADNTNNNQNGQETDNKGKSQNDKETDNKGKSQNDKETDNTGKNQNDKETDNTDKSQNDKKIDNTDKSKNSEKVDDANKLINNNNVNLNKKVANGNDNTVSPTKLPKTGYKIILIPIIAMVIIGLVFYSKYLKYNKYHE